MTKRELEELVKRQSEQISELIAELQKRPQKEFVPVRLPASPWTTQPTTSPWTYPQQTWLKANEPISVMEELLDKQYTPVVLEKFCGTSLPENYN